MSVRRVVLFLTLGALAVACDKDDDGLSNKEEKELGTNPDKADSDGDGLSDGEEVLTIGSDPLEADSDGDGYDDSAEVDANSDPVDPFNWPSGEGNWPDFTDEAAANGVVGTGWALEDVMPDFEVTDQFDQGLQLYQYYGFVVLLDLSAGWCGPCKTVAAGAEALFEEHRAEGFATIHYMTDDWGYTDGVAANVDFLQDWAQTYGLSFPVTLEAGSMTVKNNLGSAGTYEGYIPFMVLLDRHMKIDSAYTGGSNEEAINARIVELLDQELPY